MLTHRVTTISVLFREIEAAISIVRHRRDRTHDELNIIVICKFVSDYVCDLVTLADSKLINFSSKLEKGAFHYFVFHLGTYIPA